MSSPLSGHHRLTIEKIFRHPAGRNIEWRQVLSLLEDLGSVKHEHNGKFTVNLGSGTQLFEAPRGKDIDVQVIVDLRRMLREAGWAPDDEAPTLDTRQRDHGDGRPDRTTRASRSRSGTASVQQAPVNLSLTGGVGRRTLKVIAGTVTRR